MASFNFRCYKCLFNHESGRNSPVDRFEIVAHGAGTRRNCTLVYCSTSDNPGSCWSGAPPLDPQPRADLIL